METEYPAYRPIPRLMRDVRVTEKIDGTNGLIYIHEKGYLEGVGSRNRWLTDAQDNYGFRRWVLRNETDLLKLGPGHHYGEWYGSGIQRGYGLHEKRFMLFRKPEVKPDCCEVATVLYEGPLYNCPTWDSITQRLSLRGSFHVSGWPAPEGIVIEWPFAKGRPQFKITLEGDGRKNG